MRKFCAVACGALAILATTAADAQQVATSFAQLQVLLEAGDTVYITEDRGQPEWQARIVDVTAGSCLAGNVLYGGGMGALVGPGIDALIQGKKDIDLTDAAMRASLPRPWRLMTGPAMNLDIRRVTTPPVLKHMRVPASAVYGSDSAVYAPDDFASLQEKLKPGNSIVVSSDDGTRIRGRVVAVSSDRIAVNTNKGTRDIAAERVTRVQLRRNGVVLGAVIGTAIGVPFGIGLKSYANNEGSSEGWALAFPIAVGAGAGLGIDALLVRPHTVFERRAPSHAGPSFGATPTGPHGYIGGGFSVQGCSACPYQNSGDGALAGIGGGFAYPIVKGRLWVAADEYSRTQGGYFDASGGVSGVVALGSFHAHRFEPFAQAGPRWGDGGNVQWNVGAGANVWTGARLGLRIEYQHQREYTKFVSREFGPSGPGPETFTDITIAQHVVRAGIAIR